MASTGDYTQCPLWDIDVKEEDTTSSFITRLLQSMVVSWNDKTVFSFIKHTHIFDWDRLLSPPRRLLSYPTTCTPKPRGI